MPPATLIRKPVVTVFICMLLFNILITLQCKIFNPAEYESSASIELYTLPDSTTGSDVSFFLNDTVTVIIDSRHTGETDSIICRNSVSEKRHATTRKEITGFDTVLFSFDHPCTVTVYATAYSDESVATQDSITLFLDPKPGTNRTPDIRLDPIRRYAVATAPCTISVAFDDPDFWQTMSLSTGEVDPEKITIIDSLVIFTPDATDTASTIEFSITGTDNGDPPESDTKKIIITLIADGDLFPPPSDVKVDERSDEAVTISWEGDSLADAYTVYRSSTADDDDWDSVATVDGTTFTDSTDTAFFYRVVTENYFGNSEPGEVILAADTLHYGHAVSFTTDESTVSEEASNHSVTLEVSREALIAITVILDTTGELSDDARITLDTTKVVIDEGETSVEVPFTLRDDDEENGAETLTVSIESVSSGFFSGVTEHSVIVTDNDRFYTVTYDANGADDGDVPEDERRYKRDAVVTVLGNTGNLTKNGYTFTGWNTRSDGKGSGYVADANFKMPGEDVTLFAQWMKNLTYTIIYKGNGNSSGTVPVDSNNYEKGEDVTIMNQNTLEKNGYSFTCWNTLENGSGTRWDANSELSITGTDVILYAQWNINSYVITYNGNEQTGGSPPDTNRVLFDDSVTISGNANGLVKTGYLFDGWNSEHDGDGLFFTVDTTFKMGASDLDLFAYWKPDQFTLAYNGNGSTGGTPPKRDEYAYLSVVTVSDADDLIKTGNSFTGWNISPGGTAKIYLPNDTLIIGADDITLHAQWQRNNYRIIYHGNGNTGGDDFIERNFLYGERVTIADQGSFDKAEYSFTGWNVSHDGTGESFIPDSQIDMPDKDISLYAQWELIEYSLTYHLTGGTNGQNPDFYTFESDLITLQDPVKTSYVFDGWFDNESLTGEEITAVPQGSRGNREFWAKWIITDADGNIYTEIQIGEQVWMVENLMTTKYNNGINIPKVTSSSNWEALVSSGYCWYNNDSASYARVYGALYNLYTVNSGILAPEGWHVPTGTDWNILEHYLIKNGYNWDETTSGNKIAKSLASETGWRVCENVGAVGCFYNGLVNNASGFTAVSAGMREYDGTFSGMGEMGRWWEPGADGTGWGVNNYIIYDREDIYFGDWENPKYGFSIRCIRD